MESIISPDLLLTCGELLLALFLGGLIGTERNVVHKTAGMRTYALVAMGSALFVIIADYMQSAYGGLTAAEPLRMAAAVVTGIGFLGTGLIILKDDRLMGITTAAGIWVAAGIGMASGFGLYGVAIVSTILTLFIFEVLWRLEAKIKSATRSTTDMYGQ